MPSNYDVVSTENGKVHHTSVPAASPKLAVLCYAKSHKQAPLAEFSWYGTDRLIGCTMDIFHEGSRDRVNVFTKIPMPIVPRKFVRKVKSEK